MNDIQIREIDPSIQPISVPSAPNVVKPTGPGFGELLRNAVEGVNELQHASGRLKDAVVRGDEVSIHEAIIAGEKAGLSFQLMMQVRNKLLEAYKEVLRTQV